VDADIERLDRKRLRNLGTYLVFFVAFVILMLVRFFFRGHGLNEQPIGIAVLVGLIVTLLAQGGLMYKQVRIASRINRDPHLKAAFDNELLRHLESQAWKAAYIGAAATVLFFAIVSGFHPVCDPVMIALTTIIVGAGAQRATFYLKYRSS
jgi:hypothetical protein